VRYSAPVDAGLVLAGNGTQVNYQDLMIMAVNLKTAKALGLAVPPSIQLRADEAIE
jgi:hypothetical protein